MKKRFEKWFPFAVKAHIGFRLHVSKAYAVRVPLSDLTRWQRFKLWLAGFKVDAL